jgi:hypothetical protein
MVGGFGPLAGFGCGNVGFVLVVRVQHHDFSSQYRAAEIRDGHLDGLNSTHAEVVGYDSGHVIDVADHDVGSRDDRRGWANKRESRSQANPQSFEFHGLLPE